MKKSTLIIILLLIGSYTLSALAVFAATRGEFVCIAKRCNEWVSGEEWVARFCRPNENGSNLICRFSIDDKGYELPLSMIDPNNFKNCIEEECAISIYVKQTIGGEKPK